MLLSGLIQRIRKGRSHVLVQAMRAVRSGILGGFVLTTLVGCRRQESKHVSPRAPENSRVQVENVPNGIRIKTENAEFLLTPNGTLTASQSTPGAFPTLDGRSRHLAGNRCDRGQSAPWRYSERPKSSDGSKRHRKTWPTRETHRCKRSQRSGWTGRRVERGSLRRLSVHGLAL